MATKKTDYKRLAEEAAKFKKESDLAAERVLEEAVKKFFEEELEDEEDVSDEDLEKELEDEMSEEEDEELYVDIEDDEEFVEEDEELDVDIEDDDEELDLDVEDDEEFVEEEEELDLDIEDDEEEEFVEEDEELDLDIEDDDEELDLDIEDDDEELDLDVEDDDEELDVEDDDEELDLDVEDDDEDIDETFSTLENKRYLKRAALSLEKANLQNAKTKAISALFTNYRMSESVYRKTLKQLDSARSKKDVIFVYNLVKENLQPKIKIDRRKKQSASRTLNSKFSRPIKEHKVTNNRLQVLAGIDQD